MTHSHPLIARIATLLAFPLFAGCATVHDSRGTILVCALHHEELQDQVTPTAGATFFPDREWGLPPDTLGPYMMAGMEQFPFSNRWTRLGCFDDWYDRARVRYCPACRSAEAQWVASRGGRIPEPWAVWRPFPVKRWKIVSSTCDSR